MNYRHAFHAGNFADVHKHVILARILVHLAAKPAAFRVIDTHAGAGLYDVAAEEAARTGEWRQGVGRLLAAELPDAVQALLSPYREALGPFDSARYTFYPGSPAVAAALLRPQDRLIACELEPEAQGALAGLLARDRRAKAILIDGWTALSAYLPPKERRGLVLIDPPFEAPDEFATAAERLIAAWRKWPTGIFMLWYPLKDRTGADLLARELRAAAVANVLRSELLVTPGEAGRLAGSGLVIVNPPWTLHADLLQIVPALAAMFEAPAPPRLDWVTPAR